MVLTISGFLTDIDKFGRMHFVYPRLQIDRDAYGTEAKLANLESKFMPAIKLGYSPLLKNGFVVKPQPRAPMLGANGVVAPKDLIQNMLILEVEPQTYCYGDKSGWYLKLISARIA